MNSTVDERYLRPTAIIDSDHPAVVEQAKKAVGDKCDLVEKAVRIYVRRTERLYVSPGRRSGKEASPAVPLT